MWVSTDNAGVWVLNKSDFSLVQRINKSKGLPVLHIRKCLKDQQENIWIASSGGGLYKYTQNNFFHYDRRTGLKGNRVYAVHQTKDGLWASNSESGLVQIDSLGVHEYWDDPRLLNVKIKTITSDTAGRIWVGTEGKGIFVRGSYLKDSVVVDTTITPIRKDTFRVPYNFSRRLNTQDGLLANWIREIHLEGEQIWVATYSNGISRFRYDQEQDSLYAIRNFGLSDGLENTLINDIQMDSLGRLWYATKKGHVGYIQKDRVQHLGNVLHLAVDIGSLLFFQNKLYLGTSGKGVWWSDLSDPIQFKPLEGEKELHSNNIYQLIFDRENRLWAGSESGVDQVVLNESNQIVDVFHFGRNDGFLGIETCLNAVTKDERGNLWFGTLFGLTQYQPVKNSAKKIKPLLAFENIDINYQNLDSIDQTLIPGKPLQLKPRENRLAFRYRTIDINNPDEVSYRWRLDESDWSPWSTENSVNFAGLPYGDHLFEAQSRNKDWEESDIIHFGFHILQPFHETLFFKQLVIGALALIFLLVTALYIRRVKNKNRKEQERLQMANHLLSLEHKALQLQMNPHFVFNVLNGIKSMGTNDPEKMNKTINKFATLLRAILNNSREEHISLDREIQTLRNYIEVEQLMSTKSFSYEISLDESIDAEEVLIPPMLIQPFVEECYSAWHYGGETGRATST